MRERHKISERLFARHARSLEVSSFTANVAACGIVMVRWTENIL